MHISGLLCQRLRYRQVRARGLPIVPIHLVCSQARCAFPCAVHPMMRTTLRRSCDLCAKSKLRCDLLLPQCSRCQKKSPHQTICLYANTPLSSVLTETDSTCFAKSSLGFYKAAEQPIEQPQLTLSNPGTEIFDPFDSYPQTRLPRAHVQRLIQHCMSSSNQTHFINDLMRSSSIHDCLPVLSARLASGIQSIRGVLVSLGSVRSCAFPRVAANCVSGRRTSCLSRFQQLGYIDGRLRAPREAQD